MATTFFTSPVKGSGVRGLELDRCYQGEYSQGKRHGQGVYTYPNSFFKYEGQYVNGQKHGYGKLSMKDGSYYEGQFANDEIMGQGTRRFANGNVYIGEFCMGEMHGPGVMMYSSGDVFQGMFLRNTFQGEGRYTFKNGDVYEGEFSDSKITGQGVLVLASGERYEGGMVEGRREGHGRCTYTNGTEYEGEWHEGEPHGQGRLTLPRRGIHYEGTFVRGRPEALPHKLNLIYHVAEDPKAKKKLAAPAKPGVAPVPEVPSLPIALGQPLPCPLTVAAQLQQPSSPSVSPEASNASASNPAPPSPTKGAPPPPPVLLPVYTEPAQAGHVWSTAAMEFGREAFILLHMAPASPLPPQQPLSVTLCCVEEEDGGVRVRVMLSEDSALGRPLPLSRTALGEHITAVRCQLEAGQSVIEQLPVGSPDDVEVLTSAAQSAGGYLYLVCSSWGLTPGYMKLAVAEAAKGAAGAKKK